jgi:hypothetical protein
MAADRQASGLLDIVADTIDEEEYWPGCPALHAGARRRAWHHGNPGAFRIMVGRGKTRGTHPAVFYTKAQRIHRPFGLQEQP